MELTHALSHEYEDEYINSAAPVEAEVDIEDPAMWGSAMHPVPAGWRYILRSYWLMSCGICTILEILPTI